ncbi:hypothetical protein VTJ04DRAFT_792 [Mycothermus thermophilus]|uniref:uncharacterized protein n=1 Tax=Humicola insolens TaxID=85995 RepID=UPI0037429A1B
MPPRQRSRCQYLLHHPRQRSRASTTSFSWNMSRTRKAHRPAWHLSLAEASNAVSRSRFSLDPLKIATAYSVKAENEFPLHVPVQSNEEKETPKTRRKHLTLVRRNPVPIIL